MVVPSVRFLASASSLTLCHLRRFSWLWKMAQSHSFFKRCKQKSKKRKCKKNNKKKCRHFFCKKEASLFLSPSSSSPSSSSEDEQMKGKMETWRDGISWSIFFFWSLVWRRKMMITFFAFCFWNNLTSSKKKMELWDRFEEAKKVAFFCLFLESEFLEKANFLRKKTKLFINFSRENFVVDLFLLHATGEILNGSDLYPRNHKKYLDSEVNHF